MRLDHLLSRETRSLRDSFVPEVDILQKCENDGQPGKTGKYGRTTSGLGDNVKEYKSMNLRLPFKECSLYRFEGSSEHLDRTLKTAQRKDETKNE